MRTIICSTGTSIAKGLKYHDSVEAYRRQIQERVRILRPPDEDGPASRDDFRREVSAEINSLQALGAMRDDGVQLLHTDTPDGEVCAQEVARLVEEEFAATAKLRKITGLQVTNAQRFRREGVKNLFGELARIQRDSGGEVLLCVTGGFKSVVPYLTLFGLLNRIPVAYLFEGSRELINLPAAPITYDYERVKQALDPLRCLEESGEMTSDQFWKQLGVDYGEREDFECLVEYEGNQVLPSAFGFLLLGAGTQTDTVLLSPRAQKVYEESKGLIRDQYNLLLGKISTQQQRQIHLHRFITTDLFVYKPGRSPVRAAYFMKGREVRICSLAQHNEYERTFGSLRLVDFKDERFSRWELPAGDRQPEGTEAELFDRLQRDLETYQALAEMGEAEQARLQEALDGERRAAAAARAELAEARTSASDRELEHGDAAARLQAELIDSRTALDQERGLAAEARAELETTRERAATLQAELATRQREVADLTAALDAERRQREQSDRVAREIDAGTLAMTLRVARGLAHRVERKVKAWRRRA